MEAISKKRKADEVVEVTKPATATPQEKHLATAGDLAKSYYRELFTGQDTGEFVSAAQKEWRRGKSYECRHYVAVLLLSFKCERVMNRLITGILEDVSIANSALVPFAVDIHKRYIALRKECDQKDKRAKIGKGVPKSWRQDLRNSMELRVLLGELASALCNSDKSRITDHVYSAVYDLRPWKPSLEELQQEIRNEKTSLKSLLKDAMKNRGNLDLEQKIFKKLAIYHSIARLQAEQSDPKYPATVARDLVKLFDSLTSQLPTEDLRIASSGLKYICEEVYLRKSLPLGKFPAKLPLTHWVFLYTRPVEELRFDPIDPESAVCLKEAKERYELILTGKERVEVPLYALDKHTRRGHALKANSEVDTTVGGFYRREHLALSPLSTTVNDNYREEAFRKADLADGAKAGAEEGGESDEED